MPETKIQPKQRLKRWASGHLKSKALATRDEQMFLVFFNIKVHIYTRTGLRIRRSMPTLLAKA